MIVIIKNTDEILFLIILFLNYLADAKHIFNSFIFLYLYNNLVKKVKIKNKKLNVFIYKMIKKKIKEKIIGGKSLGVI